MWGGLKKIFMTEDDEPDPKMTTVLPRIIREDISDTNSLNEKKTTKPICRTPMGGYIVPPGGKPLTSLGDAYPGPADYQPKVEPAKAAAPQYSIVGKPKKRDGKRNIPGPSEYNTSGDISWKSKKVTLKGRTKSWFDAEAEKSISVLGKYKVNHLGIGSEGPKFKIGKKESIFTGTISSLVHPVDTKGFQAPGPDYRPNSSYWGRGPKKSFGKRTAGGDKQGPASCVEGPSGIFEKTCKRVYSRRKKYRKVQILINNRVRDAVVGHNLHFLENAEGPFSHDVGHIGPGDYDVDETCRGPSHSFGIKLPEPVFVQQSVNKFSPAANTYDVGTTIGKAPAVSIAGRPKEPEKSTKGPCPCTYHPEVNQFDKYTAKSLAYRWFDEEERKHPGPADYTVNHVNLQKNPSYTCRQRVKSSYPESVTYTAVKNDNPGPGSYDLKGSVAIDTPSYSLRKRLEPIVDKEGFPGPNAYSSEKHSKPGAKRAPSFSMAKRLIPPNSMKSTPGPGEYYPSQPKTERGKYTMTKRPKGNRNFVNPAPNLYTLPEAIAGKKKGVALKSRASPFVYSGFRSEKLSEPCRLPVISN